MELSNPQHEAFAQHVASGLTYTEAARRAGYTPSAAANMGSRLHQLGRVRNRIDELTALKSNQLIHAPGIRNPHARVAALEDRWLRMRTVIVERAADASIQSIPGGKTGLLVRTYKQVGNGANARVVEEYRVDTALLAELRATEQQVAEELGQWATRRETYTQSISVSVSDPRQLNQALRSQVAQLPESQREQLVKDAPELADLVIEQPEQPPEA